MVSYSSSTRDVGKEPMTDVQESRLIRGVRRVRLTPHADERGSFVETFRKEWFGDWNAVQGNCSRSRANVLRGLHFHRHQSDYWYVAAGRIRAALADLRTGSPTHGECEVLELGEEDPWTLFIPPGVAHGYLSLVPSTLIYLVDRTYDPADELGVAWNDPSLDIPWGTKTPVLSPRDTNNPRLEEIPESDRPQW
jgi:dTDP-4-dehydrorhamnose 3,5-epimerase